MRKSANRSALLASAAAIWVAAAVPVASADGPAGHVVGAFPASPAPAQQWTTHGGVTAISFELDVLAEAGLDVGEPDVNTVTVPEAAARLLAIRGGSTLTFSVVDGSVKQIEGGHILHFGDVTLKTPAVQAVISNLAISPVGEDPFSALWVGASGNGDDGLVLRRVKAGFDPVSQTLTIRCPDLRVSPALAEALGDPGLADVDLGGVVVRAAAEWVGGAKPVIVPNQQPPGGPQPVNAFADGCDMTFCQLYGHYMPSGSREGDIVGLSVATTSWNIGTKDCQWFPIPNENHPFIVMNMYRLKDGRFEQIGMSHIKHGFYALGSHQCGGPPCTYEPGHSQGNWLGTGCTDTYSAPLNAVQSGMGPKYEVNPWTGLWDYSGSHMQGSHSHDNIQHRIQVHDADLDPALNEGATYYSEGFYCMLDDTDAISSASWKEITITSGAPGNHWNFGMSSSVVLPEMGFAIDAWEGATQTLIAEEIPVKEFSSPDGRCILAAKATNLGGGMWHYEYAMLNVDMDRQVGSFSIPVVGSTVSNVGFHAVEHHDEPFNTRDPDAVPIDNAPWIPVVTADAVTWSTLTNPIRWNQLYNFRFDSTRPPTDATVTVGLFRTGTPSELTAQTVGPSLACLGDIDGSGDVGVTDFLEMLAAWGFNPGHPADLDRDTFVGITDFLLLLAYWGPCP
ncbi:MAG: hypothetical protein ACYS15_00820 [Planctomycetota bacterium]|jgi:hypothetical protein